MNSAPITLSRYWGSGDDDHTTNSNATGENLPEENQAAILLARLNAKARLKKANLFQSNSVGNIPDGTRHTDKAYSGLIYSGDSKSSPEEVDCMNEIRDDVKKKKEKKRDKVIKEIGDKTAQLDNDSCKENDSINLVEKSSHIKKKKFGDENILNEACESNADAAFETKSHKKKKKRKLSEQDLLLEEGMDTNDSIVVQPKKFKDDLDMENSVNQNHQINLENPELESSVSTKKDLKEKISKKSEYQKRKNKLQRRKKREENLVGYTLMGEVKSSRNEKVFRVLPHWMLYPIFFDRDLAGLETTSMVEDAIPSLHPMLIKKLQEQQIKSFFPVQLVVIPEILGASSNLAIRYRPRDVCVSAPTGSGKTLSFVLPIVQALSERVVPRIRALVILPVQELASQVYNVFQTYATVMGLYVGMAIGQKSFAKEQSTLVRCDYSGYHSLVDILVATPGRLFDHLQMTKGIDLSSLRYLVLDEADRMLSADGGEWVNRIEQLVKSSKDANCSNILLPEMNSSKLPSLPLLRLLFSATLSKDPEQLQRVPLYRPKLFMSASSASSDMNPYDATSNHFVRPATLVEEYAIAEMAEKPIILYHLATTQQWKKTLVFTNSIETMHKLTILLDCMPGNLKVAEFSSKQGKLRKKIINQYKTGKIDILVSSDAMARGLDVPDIEHVVSYDVISATTYVHRIGRTARAGKTGFALSLVTNEELREYKNMIRSSNNNITLIDIPTTDLVQYEAQYIDAIAKMKKKLQEEGSRK